MIEKKTIFLHISQIFSTSFKNIEREKLIVIQNYSNLNSTEIFK